MAKPHAKLRGLMIINDYTMPQLARKIGLGKSAMSERLNYRRPFALDEAYAIMRLFRIPMEQLHDIFPPGVWDHTSVDTDVLRKLPDIT